MGGITNYYHGEGGRVAGRVWTAGDELLTYRLRLRDNLHREWAQDYGTDIGIDPSLRDGSEVMYVRLDETCGIWVKQEDAHGPALTAAIKRVIKNRAWMAQYGDLLKKYARPSREWLDRLRASTAVSIEFDDDSPAMIDDRPATGASLFLSYSSRNILLARQIYNDLQGDAKADVWFDIAQSGEAPRHDESIASWLRDAIYQRRGFVLILSEAAQRSPWVQREIAWALEQEEKTNAFQFIVLKVSDGPIAEVLRKRGRVIECQGLWKSNGINEELFAALTGRCGRRQWLEAQRGLQRVKVDGTVFSYADFQSDGGVAIRFRWRLRGGGFFSRILNRRKRIDWKLTYERDGEEITASGGGDDEPADLLIKPGDRIGSFVCRHRWGTHLPEGVPVWMRTDDLAVTPDSVLDAYYEAYDVEDRFGPDNLRQRFLVQRGEDAWGRVLAELVFETNNGEIISYPKLMLRTFTQKSIASGDEAPR